MSDDNNLNRNTEPGLDKEALWLALSRYAALQNEHINALRNNRLEGLMSWRAERERAFISLRQSLNQLGDLKSLEDDELAEQLTDKIGAILASENLLQKEVREGQNKIRQQQNMLRKGQSAIKRFNPLAENSPRSRFVSNMA